MIVVLLQGVAVSKEGNLCQPREHLQLHVRQRSFRIFMKTKSFFRYEPVLYDYIWHRAHGRNMIWTNIFDVCSPSIPSHLLLWHQNWTRSYFGLWNTYLYCQVPFLKWKKFFGPENNQSTEVDRFLSIVSILWTTWISCCCPAFAFGLLSLEQCGVFKIFFFQSKMMSFSDHEAVTSSLYLWRSIF